MVGVSDSIPRVPRFDTPESQTLFHLMDLCHNYSTLDISGLKRDQRHGPMDKACNSSPRGPGFKTRESLNLFYIFDR